MACAAPTTSSTKETTNYARLCRLLVDVGTQALRDTFDAIHPPANLHAVLAANKAKLQSLRTKKIVNATQWGKLFPWQKIPPLRKTSALGSKIAVPMRSLKERALGARPR